MTNLCSGFEAGFVEAVQIQNILSWWHVHNFRGGRWKKNNQIFFKIIPTSSHEESNQSFLTNARIVNLNNNDIPLENNLKKHFLVPDKKFLCIFLFFFLSKE